MTADTTAARHLGAEETVGLSAATTVVGVIGDPVAHSLSPHLHNTAFAELGLDWVSVGFRVAAGRTAEALEGARALGVRGLSVTMPHKDEAARLVPVLSPLAERLGAVNCVVDTGDTGHAWRGENTDGAGLLAALRHRDGFDPGGRHCLVVGAGGAARAVIAALADAGAAEVIVVNRTPARAAAALALAGAVGRAGAPDDAPSCDLVVNATPVGMAGTTPGPRGVSWPIDPVPAPCRPDGGRPDLPPVGDAMDGRGQVTGGDGRQRARDAGPSGRAPAGGLDGIRASRRGHVGGRSVTGSSGRGEGGRGGE